MPSGEQPGQAEGAGVCVGDRHPPTSGLISKVMSFWRLCSTQSGRDPGCLLHPEPKDSLVTTAGTRLLGGTHGQSIHWPELDSRPFRETGLFRETETLQYGGRGRGGGNMGAPSGLVVGQRGSCGIDTAPPHRCTVGDPVVSAEVCSGWKSPLSYLPWLFSSLVQNGFFFFFQIMSACKEL